MAEQGGARYWPRASFSAEKKVVGEYCSSRSSRLGWSITYIIGVHSFVAVAFIGVCGAAMVELGGLSVVFSLWCCLWATTESGGCVQSMWLFLRSKRQALAMQKPQTTFSAEKEEMQVRHAFCGCLPPTWRFFLPMCCHFFVVPCVIG